MRNLFLSLAILISIVSNSAFKAQQSYMEMINSNYSNSQNYSTINYTQLNIIALSVKIQYSGSTYAPSKFSYSSALNTMQERYDYYYNMMNNEWGKLEKFDLINYSNKTTLNNHKVEIRNYFKNNKNILTNINWAQNGQFALKIVDYVGSIYSNSAIKSEVLLLKAIDNEFYRLKKSNPDSFHKSTRYAELLTVLNKLESCSTSEIKSLSTTYGLW